MQQTSAVDHYAGQHILRWLRTKGVLISILIFVFVAGCATEPKKPLSIEERVRVETALGAELSRDFETKLVFREDMELSVYLRKVAERLTAATPEFVGAAIGLFVIRDHKEDSRSVWRNYSLPGNRIYIAAGLLKKVEYENQLAAVIAIELGHLMRKSVLWRVRQHMDAESRALGALGPTLAQDANSFDHLLLPEPGQLKAVEYFGPRGVFNFNQETLLAAASDAVGILYRAGYAPRGVSALLDLYRARPEHSPYEQAVLGKLIQKTRRVIAESAPLRNPVVRSPEFLEIQKRIKKL